MPTFRDFTKRAFRCGLYEAEDVLLEIDDVDLIKLEPVWGLSWKHELQRRALYYDLTRRLIYKNPGIHPVRLKKKYDLFLAVCQNCWDIVYLNAIENWKDRCKVSVCWLDEIWVSSIPGYKYFLHALTQFDHVFVGYKRSVDVLAKAIDKTCYWLPGAVDTARFNPYTDKCSRVVDVYSVGRRCEGVHQALLAAVNGRGIFYVYDTFLTASDKDVSDHRQHRELYANIAKRSQYFLVAPGKFDEMKNQTEVGYRYFEGAAAGAILLGQSPNSQAFRELFDWPEAVVEVNADGSDVLEVLENLAAQPERSAVMRCRNSSQALLRHDWVHRWKRIYEVAGIEPSAAMMSREQRLADLAERAQS